MDKTILAIVAAAGGLVVGVAGARLLAPAPTSAACAPAEAAADAKADAIARQLHAHDRDPYVSQPAPPVGELPAPAKTVPASGAPH